MLPLKLSFRKRRGLSSISIILLTPEDVSNNYVLSHIIDDIVHETFFRGVDTVDIHGRTFNVFLEACGFVAEYAASSQVVELYKHVARVPYMHCPFHY